MFETFVAICLGIGLAAACGFRVFVPLLIIGTASRAEMLTLAEGFSWLSSWPAIAALALATALEIIAYYFPILDNLLDSISAPAAVIAGVVASASCVTEMDPLLKWSVAIIAGGGAAGAIKAGAVGIRSASTATTGGTANPLVATLEWIAAIVLSVLAVVVPILAAIIAILLIVILARFAWRLLRRLSKRPAAASGPIDQG